MSILTRLFDRTPERYVPYVGHVSSNIVMLEDNSFMAVLRMPGAAFELESNNTRNGRLDILNNTFRQVHDGNLLLYSHLVRHSLVTPHPETIGDRSDFAANLYSKYQTTVLTGLRANDWFVTVVIRPEIITGKLKFRARRELTPKINRSLIRQLEDTISVLQNTLHEYKPVRLGIRETPTDIEGVSNTYSEIGEALMLIRTGVTLDVPLGGSLGSSVYNHRVIFGPRSFDLNIPGRPRFGAMVSLREYMSKTRPGTFNEFLSAPYDLILSQSFEGILRTKSEIGFRHRTQQMDNVGDSESLSKGLKKAVDDVTSNRTSTGLHHLSIAVYSDAIDRTRDSVEAALSQLDTNVGDAMRRLTVFGGATPIQEGKPGAECTYYSQLPGVTWVRTRPGKISTEDFAALSSFETFSTGSTEGRWGPAPVRFRTRGGTAFDYVTHVEDVGHTMLIGRTRSGKTTWALFILACLERSMGTNGMRVIIDKDAGAKLFVEMTGGRYLQLQRGRASGLAPLLLPDTPENRAFLFNLYRGCIDLDRLGPMLPEEEQRLQRGIARQMQMPVHLRSMGGVREFLGKRKHGAGDRFEKWCAGGPMGWLLDNTEHCVDFETSTDGRLWAFDIGALLPLDESAIDDGAGAIAASVIMHQLRQMMDGRRIVVFADEARFYIETLGKVLEDMALTGRKNELMLIMAAQQPEHFLDHEVGRSLVSQLQTKIAFPDKSADIITYVNGLKFSYAAAKQVKEGMAVGGHRRFLLWREEESAVLDFDLLSMPDERAILSGRAGTVRLMDKIAKEIGNDPTERYQEFRRRYHQASGQEYAA